MMKKAWTARGEMLEVDRAVIHAIAEKNPVAARIFVTGEVHTSYIGDAATRLLVNINDTLCQNGAFNEPLFVETAVDTIRMTRFDPQFVWACFHPDVLVSLIEAEAARLHVEIDPWGMDNFDFYQEMASAITKNVGVSIPIARKDSDLDAYQNAVYLSCLLLFSKPGYLDVPVAEYFAQPRVAEWMAAVDYQNLVLAHTSKLTELREKYGKLESLTNPEMSFIADLYERNRK